MTDRVNYGPLEDRATKTIPLTKGYVTVVDAQDYEALARYKWRAHITSQSVYAMREAQAPARHHVHMHRVILGIDDPSIEVDHRDGDGLNNRRANLRQATKTENLRNMRKRAKASSRYKGVSWHTERFKWKAAIKVNKKQMGIRQMQLIDPTAGRPPGRRSGLIGAGRAR